MPESLANSAPLRAPALSLALLGLLAALFGACPKAQPPPFVSAHRGGVRLERAAAARAPRGPHAQGAPGDWLLSSALLRLSVARADASQLRNLGGAIVDATAGAWEDDQLLQLGLVVEVDGKESPTLVRSVEPELSGATPRLRIVRETRDKSLRLVTDVALANGERWAELRTRVENRGTTRRLRLGDRLSWYGQDAFAPGFGWVSDERELIVPFVVQPGRRQGYALAFPERSASVRVRKREMGWHEVTAFAASSLCPERGSVSHLRRLVVAPGPLESAAEHAWRAVGVEPGFVEAELPAAPAWAELEARDDGGRLIQSARSRVGRLRLPVPAGSYSVTLRAPGGTDRARASVRAGEVTRVALVPPAPARVSYRVADPGDAPMPARLVVRGVGHTPNPDLGPHHLASGAANVACSASGVGSLELPPGRYSVLATRGPEWDVAEEVLEVSATTGATFRARLARVVDTRGWVAADLHLHAEPSADSDVPLPDRVTSLLAEGIELAVATDHNHVTDYAPAVKELGAERQLTTRPGIEITTPDWGHFNAYPYPPSAPLPPAQDAAPRELLAFVRATAPAALIQVNHPRMGDIGYFNQVELGANGTSSKPGASLDFDLLEVWNGFDLAKPAVLDEVLAEWMRLLSLGRRYTAVGNSDSHRIAHQWAGYPRTYVRADDSRPGGVDWSEVRASLLSGRVVVTSGPFIDLKVDGEPPGALVAVRNGSVGIELEVRAPPWMSVDRAELLLDGKLALHVDASLPEQDVSARPGTPLRFVGALPVTKDAFLMVVVRGSSTLERVLPGLTVVPVAFTNPVFVDADGDGRFGSAP